jgi:hypothetical protein
MSGLANHFAVLKAGAEPEAPKSLSTPVRVRDLGQGEGEGKTPKRAARVPAVTRTAASPATGKSSHPEYEPVKIYVRKQTRKAAWRKWEDAEGGDFSDLVQHLLTEYLSA